MALLRDEAPAWLFLPHVFVDAAGQEEQRSPAPSAIERFATGAELYKSYHHWLTFLTASIVGRQAFQDAVGRDRQRQRLHPAAVVLPRRARRPVRRRAGAPGPRLERDLLGRPRA